MAQCFLDKDRTCQGECIAHQGQPDISGGKPRCLLLEMAKGVLDLLTGNTMTVRHPISAPPPEVR